MFCLASHHALLHKKKTGKIFNSRSPVLPMFTRQTWEELTALISFGLFILPVIPHENGIGISFGFLFNLSICNSLILESIYHTNQGEQKWQMINFRLDLAKQLIDGFTQRKRKRRSQEALTLACGPRRAHFSSCPG